MLSSLSRRAANVLVPAVLLFAGLGRADGTKPPAKDPGAARGLVPEAIRNDRPPFLVRVAVDHVDRVYKGGDEVKVTVVSEKKGFLYLFYRDAAGKVYCVFPNREQADNCIPAGELVAIPPEKRARFRLRIRAPYGREVLKAVVTLTPLKALDRKALARADVTPVKLKELRAAYEEIQGDPDGWAEHDAELRTVDPAARRDKPPAPRRIGVFIGVGQFRNPGIPALRAPAGDARAAAEVFRHQGRFDQVIILVNKEATRAAVEETIARKLPAATRPGDTVLIYWSGHGGRCVPEGGLAKVRSREYLVPHDGRLDSLETIRASMVLDDTFGRWLLQLDGRKVVVILDACHSAGHQPGDKGGDAPPVGPLFQKLFHRLQAMKGERRELALLASSKADEISFERRRGDHSVMTYYLLEKLRKASGSVSLTQAYRALQDAVPAYVKKEYRGAKQNPVLVDRTTPPLYLRPE